MRKVAVLAICGVFAATAVYAQTNVLSQNAVGYVKVSLTGGELKLITHQFNDIDGNPQTPSVVLGDQMPVNSKVFTWNGTSYDIEDYLAGTKTNPNAWAPDTAALEPGVGFFVEAPDAADVYLLGEVPADASNDLVAQPGLTALGFPFPASQAWTGTATAAGANLNDRFFTWNGSSYDIDDYLAGTKTNPNAWTNPDKVLTPGEGWFYDSTLGEARTATEVKPYAWP
jgi:hypothetical protein